MFLDGPFDEALVEAMFEATSITDWFQGRRQCWPLVEPARNFFRLLLTRKLFLEKHKTESTFSIYVIPKKFHNKLVIERPISNKVIF